jgi:hypothetical protein
MTLPPAARGLFATLERAFGERRDFAVRRVPVLLCFAITVNFQSNEYAC